MLSHSYRIKLENICEKIANGETVELQEIIWAEKLAKNNTTVASFLRKARRKSMNPNMKEGSLDSFLNDLDLGFVDPSDHRTSFNSPEDIADFFHNDDNMRRD